MAADNESICPSCGEETKTIGGLCPNCGVAKDGPLYGPARRIKGWGPSEDLEPLVWVALWILPGGGGVAVGFWLAGSALLTVLGALWLCAFLALWAAQEYLG